MIVARDIRVTVKLANFAERATVTATIVAAVEQQLETLRAAGVIDQEFDVRVLRAASPAVAA